MTSNINDRPAMHDMRCALVALIGVPNSGKSTLLNAMVGEKIGIVSNKPNTTRLVVRGVVTTGAVQLVLMDTPGLNKSQVAFDRQLVQQAQGAMAEADVLVVLADASSKAAAQGFPAEKELVNQAAARGQKVLLALTKIDRLKDKTALLPLLTLMNEWPVLTVVPLTALKGGGQGSGVAQLLHELGKLAPRGPWLFPPEQTTDMHLPWRLAELTREQAMRALHQELPYSVGVITQSIMPAESDASLLVQQQLVVAKNQHKPMVLGAGGQMLKTIGTKARLEMQKILGEPVRLELQVKVAEDWLDRAEWRREMGL